MKDGDVYYLMYRLSKLGLFPLPFERKDKMNVFSYIYV
jgi:hypothetical protein